MLLRIACRAARQSPAGRNCGVSSKLKESNRERTLRLVKQIIRLKLKQRQDGTDHEREIAELSRQLEEVSVCSVLYVWV